MIISLHRRSRLRVPALTGGLLLLFGGAVDAWGASACLYHGHDAAAEAVHPPHGAHAPHAGEPPTSDAHQHIDHGLHAADHDRGPGHVHDTGGQDVQGHAHGASVTISGPSPDHPAHGEHCECRLRCIAVGALPPLEPEVVEVPAAPSPQEDTHSLVDFSTEVPSAATVPFLLPFSLAPPAHN